MIKMLRYGLWLMALLPVFAWAATANTSSDFVAGKDYQVIQTATAPASPLPKDKVQVIEFFNYGCPACNHFEPALEKWLATGKPKDVAFERAPVVFHPEWDILARAYYVAKAIKVDLSKEDEVKGLAWKAIEFFDGRVDVVVNNAAQIFRKSFKDTDENDYNNIMNANLRGPLFLAKYIVNQMIALKIKGNIINISSINDQMVGDKIGDYGATKAGLSYYTNVMAYELAQHSIRVNCIRAGLVATNMNADQRKYNPTLWASRVQSIPLQTAAQPAEIAAAVLYLASDKKSSNTTGAALAIAGGSNIPIEDRFITFNNSNIETKYVTTPKAKL